MLRISWSSRQIIARTLSIAAISLLIPGVSVAQSEHRRVRLVEPRPGEVHNARPAKLVGHAVVNFAKLVRDRELAGPSNLPVRARVLEEEGEEPDEPLSAVSPGGAQAPSSAFVASPSPSASFMGLDDIPMEDLNFFVIPPDVSGAVGSTRIMSGHNNNYRIFDKSDGSVISTLGTATFWTASGEPALDALTDPRTLYDPYNNRWIAVMQSTTTGAGDILVGVSETSDPSGNWFLYRFLTGVTIDFPNVGFNKNWIAIAINRFSVAGAFQRGITLVVNYPLARAGTGSGTIFTQQANTHFASSPCATYSNTEETLYVVTHLSSSGATYTLDTITGTSSAPVYTAGGSQTRPGGGWVQPGGNLLPQSAPSSGSSVCGATPCPIETQDAQIRSAPVYRGGSIYYTQTIGLPSSGLTHTGVQWTKLNTPTGSFSDGGRIEDATATASNGGKWYVYPHIAVNSVGDFMVGYSQLSSAQHPASGYSMHLAADASGTIRDPVVYKAGEDYYHKTFTTATGRNRWGDFSSAQVDPSDDRSLWALQEYAKARVSTDEGNTGSNGSRWSTYWANVAGPAPTVTIAAGPSQNEGNAGLTPFAFTVNLSTGYSLPVTVDYQTSDGSATVGDNDYQTATGSIIIPAGLTSGMITVNAVGDTNGESNETFTLTLTSATNAVIGAANTSTGTIVNDDPYTITASAGPNGSIAPSGAVLVTPGANQGFTVTPSGCYHVADVLVDGSSVGALTTYTFTNVVANHTIAASFAINTYVINASASTGGSITPSGAVSVNCGAGQSFTISADATHTIADVLVDAVSVGAVGVYTFTGVTAGHTISASFNAIPVNTAANIPFSGISPGGVDMATGELILVLRPDLAIDGPMPLVYRRYYGSMLAPFPPASGVHGPNWLGCYDWRLSISGTDATIVTDRGQRIQFHQNLLGSWDLVSPTDEKYRLDVVGSMWQLTHPSHRRAYLFDGTSQLLTQILDAHGNSLNLGYAVGRLSQVSDGLGRTLTFSHDASGLLILTSDGTRSVSYGYTGGVLTSVMDAAGHTTSYAYATPASPGLLQSATEPLGNAPLVYSYNALGRVASHTDALGNISTYTYDSPSGNLYTDPLANTWTYLHNAQNRLTTLTDPAAGVRAFTYDALGRLAMATRPMGDVTTFAHDAASGYVGTLTLAGGSTINWGYGSHVVGGASLFDLATASYPDGASETYGRDGSGNLTDLGDRGGFHWLGTYNARGQVLTATNPSGGLTTLTYDPLGRPASRTDNAGNTTTFAYDALSRLTQETWPDLSSRSYAYDNLDHVTGLTDERGKLWSYAYDLNDRLASATDPLLEATQYTYDTLDRLTQAIDPLSHATQYAYDPAGRLASTTDRTGRITTYAHDSRGHTTGITDPAGGTFSFSYDADGRTTSTQDPLGHIALIGHDFRDRVTQITDPVGSPFDFSYDSMGRLLSASAPLGHAETFGYDPRGLLTSFFDVTSELDFARTPLGEVSQLTDPNRNAWPRGYDSQGRPTSAADPLGRTTSLTYDSRSWPVHADLPMGSVDVTYDPAKRPGQVYFSDGTTLTYGYDDANRLTGGTGASFAYDAAGRMTASNGLTMTYDNEGRITSETYASGRVVNYTYDSRGLLTQVTDWVGGATAFSYDAAGRLTGMTRPNGTTAAYGYDAADRLLSAVEANPGPIQISSIALTRDALGQATSIDRRQPLMPAVTSPGATSFTYDAASQITGLTWDPLGRLVSDGTRTFEWDGASRLTHYAAGADSPRFTYDAFGRMLSRTLGGSTEQYVWNYAHGSPTLDAVYQGVTPLRYYVYTPMGLLLDCVDATSGARNFYHYDEAGNAMFLTNNTGSVVTEYSYTPFGGVTAVGQTASNLFTFDAAAGAIQLGSSGLFRLDGIFDANTSRVISGDAVKSGADGAHVPLHETGHVLGLAHEQQRFDREDWVTKNPGSNQIDLGPYNIRVIGLDAQPGPIELPVAEAAGFTWRYYSEANPGPRRYQAFLGALADRIPVHTPEWTDLSGADPANVNLMKSEISEAGMGNYWEESASIRPQSWTLVHEVVHAIGQGHGGTNPGPGTVFTTYIEGNPTTIRSATGGAGAGKAEFNEFTIKKTTVSASPAFFKNCVAGAHYNKEISCFGIGAYGEFERFLRDVASDSGGRYYSVP